MTTIAYKDGEIAYDGRRVHDATIVADDVDKAALAGENIYFAACAPADPETFADAHAAGQTRMNADFRALAFVVKPHGVYLAGANEGEIWEMPIDSPYAIGSGADHALTAMDLGCSAKGAVIKAAARDTHTGGRIRVYDIASGKLKKGSR